MPENNCYWSPSASCNVELNSDSNKVFVIGSNADDRREYIERIMKKIERFDLIPRFAIDLKGNNGYQAFCANICTEIRACRFIIADLSGARISKGNNCICSTCESEDCDVRDNYQFSINVFWEYGYASGLNKRCILICDEDQYLPFDIADKEVEFYNGINLEEKVGNLIKQELDRPIDIIEKKSEIKKVQKLFDELIDLFIRLYDSKAGSSPIFTKKIRESDEMQHYFGITITGSETPGRSLDDFPMFFVDRLFRIIPNSATLCFDDKRKGDYGTLIHSNSPINEKNNYLKIFFEHIIRFVKEKYNIELELNRKIFIS